MSESMTSAHFLTAFREAGPYLNAHRGRTLVIVLSGCALQSTQALSLLHDIALLHSLGLKVVLVHGARHQIDQKLLTQGLVTDYINGVRITDAHALPLVIEAINSVTATIQAKLSMGLPNMPMHGAELSVISGNFITARPIGVLDGVDFHFSGEVRKINIAGIRNLLTMPAVVLIQPLGVSPTGELFDLNEFDLAKDLAVALAADKLLIIDQNWLQDYALPLQYTASAALAASHKHIQPSSPSVEAQLSRAANACQQGVKRVHLLDSQFDGSILKELFTRHGIGILITEETYQALRPATIDDVGGLLALIRPFEKEGILVRRSRERLEQEIDCFQVLLHDGLIVGCAALYPLQHESTGELACVVIHPDYRKSGYADALLRAIEVQATALKLKQLFALTTHTAHWFIEHGFVLSDVDQLPISKKIMYNYQRRSKVLIKQLGKL